MAGTSKAVMLWVGAVAACLLASAGSAIGDPGKYADPEITSMTVSITSTSTCHINHMADAVYMEASAVDTDSCEGESKGNRIDLPATEWSVPVGWGNLNARYSSYNFWWAGDNYGTTDLTVTFDDLDDGPDYDDDTDSCQKQLTAFRVGVRLTTSEGDPPETIWEEGQGGNASKEIQASLSVNNSIRADGDDMTPATETDDETGSATWTLVTDPADTPMKGTIRAWVQAKSVSPMQSTVGSRTAMQMIPVLPTFRLGLIWEWWVSPSLSGGSALTTPWPSRV